MCLSPYVFSYPPSCLSVYAGLCCALRRHVCLHVYGDLCRETYREPYPALNRTSFRKPFGKPNPALFHWLYGFKYRKLFDSVNPAPNLQTQPPGQRVGR